MQAQDSDLDSYFERFCWCHYGDGHGDGEILQSLWEQNAEIAEGEMLACLELEFHSVIY